MNHLINNFKNRSIWKIVGIYLASGWTVIQIVEIISKVGSLPDWILSFSVIVIILGFPIVMALSLIGRIADSNYSQQEANIKEKKSTNWIVSITSVIIFSLIGGMFFWMFFNDQLLSIINAKSENISNTESKNTIMFGTLNIFSDPEGASVNIADIDSLGNLLNDYKELGNTPINNKNIPVGNYLVKFEKRRWNSLTYTIEIKPDFTDDLNVFLVARGPLTNEMVFIPSGASIIDSDKKIVNDFYIDKYEVSNEDFLKFIINGGYENMLLWPEEMLVKGNAMKRDKAVQLFIDKSGQPSPRGWSGSMYPTGTGQYPVTGVNWYEANAYAKSIGKRLPSIDEWWRAAIGDPDSKIKEKLMKQIQYGNFLSDGLKNVGYNIAAVSLFGVVDMAGNVREWTSSYTSDNRISYVGGSWKDPIYIFDPDWQDSYPPFLYESVLGFRCALSAND